MMVARKRFLTLLLFVVISIFSLTIFAAESFKLKGLEGHWHQLEAYKGKWVIVNYWATWCPPCLEEIPVLVNLYDNRKNRDLMVIGVVFDYETVQEVKTYMDDMLMSYPVVLGNEDVISQVGSADSFPTSYIYNPSGELVKIKKGIVSRSYLESIIGKR